MKTGYWLVLVMLMTGCASHKVIIDRSGVDMSRYQHDLQACQVYAEEVESGRRVASGAVGGAIAGGAIGAIVGNRRTVAKAAGVGSVTGAARGGGSAAHEKNRVVKNCLRGRGYKVLN